MAEATGRRFLFLAAVSRPRNNGASLPVFAAARFPDEGFAEIYFSLVVRSSAKKKFVRTDTLTAPVGTDTANFDGTFSLVFLGFCLLCAFARLPRLSVTSRAAIKRSSDRRNVINPLVFRSRPAPPLDKCLLVNEQRYLLSLVKLLENRTPDTLLQFDSR